MNAHETYADQIARLDAIMREMISGSASIEAAAGKMAQVLVADRSLLRALLRRDLGAFAEQELRALSARAADAGARREGDGAGQGTFDAQAWRAPSSPTSEDRPAKIEMASKGPLPAASSPPDAAAGRSSSGALPPAAPAASPERYTAPRNDLRAMQPQPLAAPLRDRPDQERPVFRSDPVRPVASPKPSFRSLAVSDRVRHVARSTILDTFKVRDGRAIGDLLWRELTVLARENEHEGRVLRALAGHVANADPEAPVRSIVKAETVAAIVKEVGHGA